MGPLGPNGLRRLIRRGEVIPGTMVRREDHQYPIRADHVRGLFGDERPDRPKAQMQGPFTSLRTPGWFNTGAMGIWCVIGLFGVLTAWSQRQTALAIAAGAEQPLTDAHVPFLGLGGVIVATLFVVTGVGFSYWLWCARVNLPHLIDARIRFAPSWTIAGWLVPVVNLFRPYQVIEEIDRLGAEAAADGDASVRAQSLLLVPWWICTLLFVAFAAAYRFAPVATAEQIANAALWHAGASVAVLLAAAFGAFVFLRITVMQERAHDSHPGPVKLHHDFNHKQRAKGAATA
jgi:hypothetical protein